MKDSLKWLLDKFPVFLDKNSGSNFYKSTSVINDSFKDFRQDLFNTHLSHRLDKRVLVWKEQEVDYDYTMNFFVHLPFLKTVNVYKNDALIYSESYEYDDEVDTFVYSYDDTSVNVIPDDKYYVTVETWEEYVLAKGFPENDVLVGDMYDHDKSLDELGALYDIPRKNYSYTESTNPGTTEPAYNDRLTEDDYHYMNRILFYVSHLQDTPLPVLEVWKLFGISLDEITFTNREKYLCKMFEKSKHLNSDGFYDDGWTPKPWEHKDPMSCPVPERIFFFVNVVNASPIGGQPVQFKFLFLNEYGEEMLMDYPITAYLDDTVVEEGITSKNWVYASDELTGTHKFKFTTDSGLVSDEIQVIVKDCTNADWYVATDGSDSNEGSVDYPFKTVSKALSMVEGSKNVIVLAEGTYNEVWPQDITTPTSIISCQGAVIEFGNSTFFRIMNEASLYLDKVDLEYLRYIYYGDDTWFVNNNIWNNPLFVRVSFTNSVFFCIDGELINNPTYPIEDWAGNTDIYEIIATLHDTNVDSLLEGCTGLHKCKLVIPEATSCDSLFEGCTNLTAVFIDLKSCTDCTDMFTGCTSFTGLTIHNLQSDIVLPQGLSSEDIAGIVLFSNRNVHKVIDCNGNGVSAELFPIAEAYNCELIGYGVDISSSDLTKYEKGTERFEVTVEMAGTPVEDETVTFTIAGNSYERTTDANGKAGMNINFAPGEYTMVTSCEGVSVTNTVTVLSRFVSSDVTKYEGGSEVYTCTVLDTSGDPVASGTSVNVTINGTTTAYSTDNDGVITVPLLQVPGEYILTVSYDSCSVANTIDILSRLVASDLTAYGLCLNDVHFTAEVFDATGTHVPDGSTVTFNINGNDYTRQTLDGIANLNIGLSPGTYPITTSFSGVTSITNTVRLLPRLMADDLTMVFGDGSQFVATVLDCAGNLKSGEAVIFNINGVTYNRTTDVLGQAKLSISLVPGTYLISTGADVMYITNTITVNAPSGLSFTSSVDHDSIVAGETAVFGVSLTDSGGGIAGESVDYEITSGGTVLDSGSVTTDSNGAGSVSYTGTGAGSVTCTFSWGTSTTSKTITDSASVPSSLSVTGTKSIVSYYDSESSVLTATVLDNNSSPVSGASVLFKNGSTVLDTVSTNASGVATYTYNSSGAGDVTLTVEVDGTLLQETYVVEDCFYYSSTERTFNNTSLTVYSALVTGVEDVIDEDFILEYDLYQINGNGGFNIGAKSQYTPPSSANYRVFYGTDASKFSINNRTTSSDYFDFYTYSKNTWYHLELKKQNGVFSAYYDNTFLASKSPNWLSNYNQYDLYWISWSNCNAKVKNIKLKRL